LLALTHGTATASLATRGALGSQDIFALFDRVVVLCEGGRVVFEGAPQLVPAYLKRAHGLGLCPGLPKVGS
jgi:hypothetical protein